MNKVELIGNLTRDIELFNTNEGKSVANFSIAVNGYGDRTDFFPIVVWGNQADNCAKYLKKGSKVGIIGRLQNRSYEANDGSKRNITEVVGEEVEFLSPKEDKEEVVSAKRERPTLTEITEDLPF